MTDWAIILMALLTLQSLVSLALLPIAYIRGIVCGKGLTEKEANRASKQYKPQPLTAEEKAAIEERQKKINEALNYYDNYDPMK